MASTLSAKSEKRIDKRTPMTCHAYVHGVTESGKRIKVHTITDNISQRGLFLHTPHPLKPGSMVFIFTLLPTTARLAVRGKVVRVEKKDHGLSGLAVCFSQYRLIPAP